METSAKTAANVEEVCPNSYIVSYIILTSFIGSPLQTLEAIFDVIYMVLLGLCEKI